MSTPEPTRYRVRYLRAQPRTTSRNMSAHAANSHFTYFTYNESIKRHEKLYLAKEKVSSSIILSLLVVFWVSRCHAARFTNDGVRARAGKNKAPQTIGVRQNGGG